MEVAATNVEPAAIKVELSTTNVEPAATDAVTKTDVPVANTAPAQTEPVEDDKPKLPLWKAALKQRKEAEVKKKDEEQKKLVSNHFCTFIHHCS